MDALDKNQINKFKIINYSNVEVLVFNEIEVAHNTSLTPRYLIISIKYNDLNVLISGVKGKVVKIFERAEFASHNHSNLNHAYVF